MKEKENLTLHQVSLRALLRAPLQIWYTWLQYLVLSHKSVRTVEESHFPTWLTHTPTNMACPLSAPWKNTIHIQVYYKQESWPVTFTIQTHIPAIISEPKAWDFYPADCQSFRRWYDYFERLLETSEDVSKNSKVLRFHDLRLGSTEEEQCSR